MLKRKHLILSFFVFCLATPLLVGVTSSAEYDPWKDTNDDGIIDLFDVVALAARFGTTGTPINKTAVLLDFQARVEALESQLVPQGYIGVPAYDSGWTSLPEDDTVFYHNLKTTDVLVCMMGQNGGWEGIHIRWYMHAWIISLTNNQKPVTLFLDSIEDSF